MYYIRRCKNQNEFIHKLMELKKLVYKSISCGGGKGFKMLEYDNGKFFINRESCERNDGIAIIEANASCGMRLAQTFLGQRNDKIGLWMKEWGYFK